MALLSSRLAAAFLAATVTCLFGPCACSSEDAGPGSGGHATGGSASGGQSPGGGGAGTGGDGTAGEGIGGQISATLGSLTPAELSAELAAKDFLLVNVHTPNEGEIPGTDTHIPFDDIPALAAYLGADLGVSAVLYCKSDFMSITSGDHLVALGYGGLRYLEGGMMAWEAAGYPLNP